MQVGSTSKMNELIDRLQRATLHLSQDGSIKDRLAEAFASHLMELDADELPVAVRADFDALADAMQRERPLPGESSIRASVRKMSVDEARRHAAMVVRLFAAVAMARSTPAIDATASRRVKAQANAPILQLLAGEN